MSARDRETAAGADLYHSWCWRCHGANGIGGGVNPDLRDSVERLADAFVPIVANGLDGTSMPGFSEWLEEAEIADIQRYLEQQARAPGRQRQ